MKKIKSTFIIIVSLVLLLGSSSCIVLHENGNSGGHRGWFKNSNNPHNPATTNPGHSGGKGRNK